MKKLAIVSSWLLTGNFALAQSQPILPIVSLNVPSGTLTVQAPYEIFTPYQGLGPVHIYNTAQVDFKARDRVHLGPGFHAGSFTGNGYFHAQVGVDPDFDVVFIEPNSSIPQVGQFEKLEMGIKLPAALQWQIHLFTVSQFTSGINPFDPEQISVEVLFTKGNESYTIYGFYYREFERTADRVTAPYTYGPLLIAEWDEQYTDYPWRIRWAPPTTGVWNCSISIRLSNSLNYSYQVNGIQFNCIGSTNEGWLEKGQSNWNLRYNGTHNSFFALGQNIAWPGTASEYGHPLFYGAYDTVGTNNVIMYGGGMMDVLDWTANLADNGGNMVRFVATPEGYEFEWEHLNNYYDRLTRAWEVDRMFELCEEKNMKIFYCMEFHPKYGDTSGLSQWEHNPYNLEIPGVDITEEFLTNETAKKKFKAKLRYFLSRWGYSTSLGVFELLSEMDYWYYQGHSEFKHNHNAQLQQQIWHEHMLPYVKELVSFRPMLTASSCGGARGHELTFPVYNSNHLDITTTHSYYYERNVNKIRFDELNQTVFNRGQHVLWPEKPTVFDEMGIAGQSFENPDRSVDADDVEGCNDVTYHNALWATSMMGGMGTGLQWWQWSNNGYRQANFPALAAFFSDIDFESGNFIHPDFWDNADPWDFNHSTSTVEAFYNTANNKKKTMAWVHNATYWWGNINATCYDRNGLQMDPDESNNDFPQNPGPWSSSTQFEIHGLEILQDYYTEYWLTRMSGGLSTGTTVHTNIFGTLKPFVDPYQQDCAIKAYRSGNPLRSINAISYDTLRCGQDTVFVQGSYPDDTLNDLQYHWNFGNGQFSNSKHDTVLYTHAGTYLVTLVVSDSIGWTDTLMQYVVVPECNSAQRIKPTSRFNIYPNPATDVITIELDSGLELNTHIKIITIDGRVVHDQYIISNNSSISVADLSNGMYILYLASALNEETLRLIIAR